ncbi:MAG: putative lipid II flippase FtsW [Clostridia bacterium]|nr:putative lipid II flippase FtsW [Clostridia bacterium]
MAAAHSKSVERERPTHGLRSWLYTDNRFDTPFLIVLLILLTIGLACMFSASYVYAYYQDDDSYYYIRRQLIFAGIGLATMLVMSCMDYHKWHKLSLPVMGFAVILLIVVLLIPSEDGVQRWIYVGGFNIQPSEIAKFALILLFAHMISLNHKDMKNFKKGFLPFMAVIGVICLLTLLEPHLSGTMLIFALGFVMMYIGGARPLYLGATLGFGAVALIFMIFVLGYERDRIDVWLNLFEVYKVDRDTAWQTMQSLYAIGSGGLLGQGFGNSRQKHLYLPEPQNDFIFAIVCEELGFVGAAIIIILFAILVWRGFIIAMRAPDKFGFMFAIGLTAQIALQVAINIAVVTNLLPNTGISLPFFSYGGSSLVMLLAQMGILLSVSRWSTK